MERDHICCLGHTYRHCQRTQKNLIVDDPKSSNPHSLLPWFKRQLQTFAPINIADYSPTLPPAA